MEQIMIFTFGVILGLAVRDFVGPKNTINIFTQNDDE